MHTKSKQILQFDEKNYDFMNSYFSQKKECLFWNSRNLSTLKSWL